MPVYQTNGHPSPPPPRPTWQQGPWANAAGEAPPRGANSPLNLNIPYTPYPAPVSPGYASPTIAYPPPAHFQPQPYIAHPAWNNAGLAQWRIPAPVAYQGQQYFQRVSPTGPLPGFYAYPPQHYDATTGATYHYDPTYQYIVAQAAAAGNGTGTEPQNTSGQIQGWPCVIPRNN